MTQIAQIAGDQKRKVARRVSGAGGAALRENREGRAHYAADGSFADTREMLSLHPAIAQVHVIERS